MQDYQQRVVEELSQLNIKREKLRKLIMDKDKFTALPDEDQSLLSGQMILMRQYADILKRRIARFEANNEHT